MAINPHTPQGEKILFNHPHRGTTADKQNAKMHLSVGAEYTVNEIRPGILINRVFLKEIPVISFPVRMFENINNERWGYMDKEMGTRVGISTEDI